MKYSYLLFLMVGLLFFQCESNSDDSDRDVACKTLNDNLDNATLQKVEAFEAYTKDPSDAGVCEKYVEALENRIKKIEDLLLSGCIDQGPIFDNLEAAAIEDQETIDGLNC